ncbi:uncharacterized protein LOC127750481 isoform X2 [Frankliniella occidentalis]|uniref:Uncharacterized protein LOC127750481 isoform X2 n=1 Tax=Frankliniella occidentalis TaxID=133901 RepID=A0A9C6X2W9_FRAOC|nr:uncharacterized protein LOC127750481 isoform X2 [Frankliniella occidentalis]
MTEPQLKCSHCEMPPFLSLQSFVAHLKTHLKEDKRGESVTCPFSCNNRDGSLKYISTPSALSQHLSKIHPTWLKRKYILSLPQMAGTASVSSTQEIAPPVLSQVPETPAFCPSFSNVQDFSQPSSSHIDQHSPLFDNLPEIAKFYLALEAKHLVPTVSVQRVCSGVANLSSLSHEAIAQTLRSKLSGVLPGEEIDANIYQVQVNDPVYNTHHNNIPGPDLATDYKRKLFYKINYQLQEAKEYRIGIDSTRDDLKIAYVHMRRTIELMLEDPSIQEQVDASLIQKVTYSTRFPGSVIKSYKDGSAYKKKAAATGRTKTIDIIFYCYR